MVGEDEAIDGYCGGGNVNERMEEERASGFCVREVSV